jgi:phage tail tube protein FII
VKVKIVNIERAHCWINGNEYLGEVEEGSVEAKRKLLEYDGFGMAKPVKIPSGKFESITGKLKMKITDVLAFRNINKNRGFVNIKLSGKAVVFNSKLGEVQDDNISMRISGVMEEVMTPDFKTEVSSKELNIDVWFLEVSHNGSVILKVDVSSGEVIPRDLV